MASILLISSGAAQAGLVNLNNEDMQSIAGQGGADLSWTLSLNHKYANDMSLKTISTVDATGKTTVWRLRRIIMWIVLETRNGWYLSKFKALFKLISFHWMDQPF